MPRGEQVSNQDILTAVLQMTGKLQPLVTEIAVLSERLETHSVSINEKVDHMHAHFDTRLTEQDARIDSLTKAIEQYQDDRRLAKYAIRGLGVMIGTCGAVFYNYRDKVIAVIHAAIR